jgi:type I restriction enzyme R subunit
VALRERRLADGWTDYLLFVEGKAAGVIEAKKAGTTLSGVEAQTSRYIHEPPAGLAKWGDPLPFAYESTGVETFFRDDRDPSPRSRRVFAFHQPAILLEWLKAPDTLRARLRAMPPLPTAGLRDCQVQAIRGLEDSLAHDRPRALIQMATGSGKTFTACNFIYRLLEHAGAKRVLFLVDRNTLGRQAYSEFQAFHPGNDGRAFTSLYNVQHQRTNRLDPVAKVVITTIQRLFSMLSGEEEMAEDDEEVSLFERGDAGRERRVSYDPRVPIETFDFIVTDECHRSIYKSWRQVLDYFDAHIIGLTATPSKQTLGFFQQNVVMEYPYERSVLDRVNVDYQIYRIRTEVGDAGATVDAGFHVGRMDKRTRMTRWEQLDEDLAYLAAEVDRTVTARDQIRTVLTAYRDRLDSELFPGRIYVPKTLIFAKDDHHAEEIVRIAREVFDKGNDFARKITYRTEGDPQDVLTAFRNDMHPRIAVTVDMIATGTDVKPIEVLIFMRDVKSAIYYEQMKGRGARTISPADLQGVTPDAAEKTHFLLIDAVGVTETLKADSQPLDRKRSVSFASLLDRLATGDTEADTLEAVAARLTLLDAGLEPAQRTELTRLAGGIDPAALARTLYDAVDPDAVTAAAAERFGRGPTEAELAQVATERADSAIRPFGNPALRRLLADLKTRSEMVIDEVTKDAVTYAGYDVEKAKGLIQRFEGFVQGRGDEITALQIILGRPQAQRRLTYAMIEELRTALLHEPVPLDTAQVWQAYERLRIGKVRRQGPERVLTDIVQLVRFAAGRSEVLEPFGVEAERRFNLWLGRQKKAGRGYSDEQEAWLRLVLAHVSANADITRDDIRDMPEFADRGGIHHARALFGAGLDRTLDDLTETLVA